MSQSEGISLDSSGFRWITMDCGERGITSLRSLIPGWGKPDQMDARSLRELPFLFLRFCRSKLRKAPKQKCPRHLSGDIHLICGEGGCRTYLSKPLSVEGFRKLTIPRSLIGP